MYVSARERLILEVLLERREEITVKELADHIDVSVRTVHRDLKSIEALVQNYGLTLQKKAGVGIQLTGRAEKVNELKLAISHLSYSEYTPEERQTMLLCALLESREPVKLLSLAHDLRVTIATVSQDLTKLEQKLLPMHLTVIRKRGYGVELEGSEADKRQAMKNVIADQVDGVELLSLVRESIQKKAPEAAELISERLLGLVEKKKLLVVEKAVQQLNETLPYAVADSAYIGLVVHLALAIERIERGGVIQMDQSYLAQLQAAPEYKFAEEMTRKLKAVFHLDIPEAETGYIAMHLQGAKLRQDKEYVLEESSFQLAVSAKSLIQLVEKKLNVPLLQDQSLFQGLVVHLKPALYRIQQNMGITNPLLGQIKKDYAELFNVIQKSAAAVFPDLHVPEAEIGYLVMHFGAALSGAKPAQLLSAYIICATGIGTSKMLAMRLQQEIPELANVKNISLFELNKQHIEGEAVISTIALPDFQSDYIVVSPIPTPEDIAKVHDYLRRKQVVKPPVELTPVWPVLRSPEEIKQSAAGISRYADTVYTVLDSLFSFDTKETAVKAILTDACRHIPALGPARETTKALLEREQLGGLGIPGTSLAFFHARHKQRAKPVFGIVKVREPVFLKGMDQADMAAKTLIIMLAPEPFHAEGLETLSFISAMMIESDESIALFESGSKQELEKWLAKKLEEFLHEKISELRSVYE